MKKYLKEKEAETQQKLKTSNRYRNLPTNNENQMKCYISQKCTEAEAEKKQNQVIIWNPIKGPVHVLTIFICPSIHCVKPPPPNECNAVKRALSYAFGIFLHY